MDDHAVVAAMRRREPAGLEAAYRRYADRLHTYARTLLREPDAAADAVHDAFLTATRCVDQLRDPARLRPWLYTIVRNECLRQLRTRARGVPLDDLDPPVAEAPDPTATVNAVQLRELVHAAAAGLGPADREVVDLALRHQLSVPHVAEVLGLPTNHVHARLSRARAQLERSLGALIVARGGARDCPDLTARLVGWDGHLTPLVRKRVIRHIDACAACTRHRQEHVNPAALLGAYVAPPFLVVGAGVWERLFTPGGGAADPGTHAASGPAAQPGPDGVVDPGSLNPATPPPAAVGSAPVPPATPGTAPVPGGGPATGSAPVSPATPGTTKVTGTAPVPPATPGTTLVTGTAPVRGIAPVRDITPAKEAAPAKGAGRPARRAAPVAAAILVLLLLPAGSVLTSRRPISDLAGSPARVGSPVGGASPTTQAGAGPIGGGSIGGGPIGEPEPASSQAPASDSPPPDQPDDHDDQPGSSGTPDAPPPPLISDPPPPRPPSSPPVPPGGAKFVAPLTVTATGTARCGDRSYTLAVSATASLDLRSAQLRWQTAGGSSGSPTMAVRGRAARVTVASLRHPTLTWTVHVVGADGRTAHSATGTVRNPC